MVNAIVSSSTIRYPLLSWWEFEVNLLGISMEISWEITDFEFISPIIGCEKCV